MKFVKLKKYLLLSVVFIMTNIVVPGTALCWFWEYKPWEDVTFTPDEVYQKLFDADKIIFKGKINHDDMMIQDSSIWVGDECVGGMLGPPFFSGIKYTLVSGETEFYNVKYGHLETGEKIKGSTFACYSVDGEIIGYAQEALLELDDFRERVYFFYDELENKKPYLFYQKTMYSADGTILAKFKDELPFWPIWSRNFNIEFTLYDNSIDLVDKLFLYKMAVDSIEKQIQW